MKESYFYACVNGQLLYKYICNVQKRNLSLLAELSKREVFCCQQDYCNNFDQQFITAVHSE